MHKQRTESHSVYIERTIYIEVHVEVQRGYSDTWWQPGMDDEAHIVDHCIDVDFSTPEWLELTPDEQKQAVKVALDRPPMPPPKDDYFASTDTGDDLF